MIPSKAKKKPFFGLPHQSGQTSGANVLLGKLFLHAVVDLQCNAIAMRAEEFALEFHLHLVGYLMFTIR